MFTSYLSEFCGWENAGLDVTPEAIPSSGTWVDYLLAPPPDVKEDKSEASDKATPKKGHGSGLVIFAIDVSGSMAATAEVPALQGQCVHAYNGKCPLLHTWRYSSVECSHWTI